MTSSVSRHRRDHQALLPQVARVGGHRAGRHAADVGVVRAGHRVADDRARRSPIGDTSVTSGRWVPPVYGSLRIQVSPGTRTARSHGRDGLGHRAEVHRDVLGLGDHPGLGVEQRGRAVPALLDVRGVRAAHQRRAHLLGDPGQRAAQHRQGDGSRLIGPPGAAPACRPRRPARPSPGGTRQVASGISTTAGPSDRAARTHQGPVVHRRVDLPDVQQHPPGPRRGPRDPGPLGAAQVRHDPRPGRDHAQVDDLDRLVVDPVPVAPLVGLAEGRLQLGARSRRGTVSSNDCPA